MNLAEIEARNEGSNRPWGTLAQGDIRLLITRVRELEQQLSDMTDGYYRWHAAYMELKYPNGSPPFPGSQSDMGAE